MTNHRFRLESSFQVILYMIDVWINKGSDLSVESIESQYIKVLTYGPLPGRCYMDLPIELRSPKKGLISIKNKDQKCFLWCHARHINPPKEHQKKKLTKKLLKDLIMMKLSFLCKKKILARLK